MLGLTLPPFRQREAQQRRNAILLIVCIGKVPQWCQSSSPDASLWIFVVSKPIIHHVFANLYRC